MNDLNVTNLNNSGVIQCITCSKIKLQRMYKGRRTQPRFLQNMQLIFIQRHYST
jgi:hypothetical protein